MIVDGVLARIVWGIFPLSLGVAAVFCAGALFFPRTPKMSKAVLAVIFFHASVYLGSLMWMLADPVWSDNGAEEFIPAAERWRLAMGPWAGAIEIVALPFFSLILFLWIRRSGRKEEK